MIRYFYLLSIFFILSSCAEGEIFGPKKPPLPGQRLNVLHYDLMKENIASKTEIHIPEPTNLSSWIVSDIGQYTGLPYNISLANKLSLKNKFTIANFNKSEGSALLIINNIIYNYSRNILSAYDTKLKKLIWSVAAVTNKNKHDIISGGLAYKNNVIYLASGTPDLIAFDATTGKELWRFTAPSVIRYIPLIQNDNIYVVGSDNTLSCLSLNGALLWRYDAPIYSLVSNRIYLPVIIYQDKIINITTAGDLVALNRYDGTELTQVNLANAAIIGDGSLEKGPIASPYLDKDYLYILNGEHEYIKIDLANPQILWHQNIANAKAFWVAGDFSFVLTRGDNQLISINNSDGKVVWVTPLDKNPDKKELEYYGPILAGSNIIIASRSGDIIVYSAKDGKELNRYKTSFSTHQMPLIINNQLYFIGYTGNISIWQ